MDIPEELTTPQERRLQVLLRILAFLFGLAVLGYLLPALIGLNKPAFIQLPFVTNSVVKVGVLGLLSFFASGDVRRYRLLTLLVIIGHILSELAVAAELLWRDTIGWLTLVTPVESGPTRIPIETVLIGSMVLDGLVII